MKSKEIIEKILESADVKINGDRPWDIKVLNDEFYDRVISDGLLGVGESYMDGFWDCNALDEMIYRTLKVGAENIVTKNLVTAVHVLKAKILNLQTKTGSKEVAKKHYDLDNDLYMAFLDPYSQYSCGYFKDTNDLSVAQEKKLDLICKKLELKSTDKVLDIGCGWGGFAKYAAEHYNCHVTGISISNEQIKYAKEFTKNLPVDIEFRDYRDIDQEYDKIVSVGMFEHVGYKNYRPFISIVKSHIKENGLFLLHTIGRNNKSTIADPWITKYIFPNSMAPSPEQVSGAFDGLFILEDWHNFGSHYDLTLLAWWKNFHREWPKFKAKYDERFYRMFRYYLLACAGAFRSRDLQLWQMVLSPKGVFGGYESIR